MHTLQGLLFAIWVLDKIIHWFDSRAGAPLEISEDLVTTFNISLVVRGTISETSVDPQEQKAQEERYKAPKESKIFRWALPHAL